MKKNQSSIIPYAGWKKLFLMARITTVLLFAGLMQVTASVYSQQTKLNLKLKDAPVESVLKAIEDQSEFYFLYRSDQLKKIPHVNLDIEEALLEEVLNQVITPHGFDYEIDDRVVVIKKVEKTITEEQVLQQKTVSGKVTDNSGTALPGVTVVVKGTTRGTITDTDGNYTLPNVPSDATLVFSFLGMKTREIVVGNQTTVNVTMEEEAIELEEVVAVGYGVQKRINITGSVAMVESDKLTKVPATNTSSLLAGRLPGMIVTNNSGQPGRDEADISIRGFGDALVIVDGMPRDFQQLDPNEIESVTILKDASAAVYGARAGNGVVLVTTKKGSRGSAPKINYTGNFSFQQPTFMAEVAGAADYASYFQQAENMAGVLPENYTYSDEDIKKYEEGVEPGYEGADWQDIVLRDWAPMQQHNINLSGGTEKVNYFLSLGNLNQQSLLESGAGVYNRYNISSNVDVNVSEKLKFGLNLKYRIEDRDDPISRKIDPNEYALVFLYLTMAKPTVGPIPGEPDLMSYLTQAYENPLAYSRQDIAGFSKDKRKQFDMTFSMDYKLPVKGFSVDGKLYLKNYDRLNRSVRKPYTVYSHDYETGENIPMASLVENAVDVVNWKYNQITSQFALRYDRQFGDHNLSGMVLAEYLYTDDYEFGADRSDLISTEIPYLYSGNGTQTNYDIPNENGRKSVVSRLNYNYKEKYLLEFLFRADASIQFPEDTRWGYFPGVSLGWRMSEESFLKDSPIIDYLKLRASYASLGYDAISTFDYLTGYELVNQMEYKYGYGGQMNQSTLQSIGLANEFITWESMNLYNIGADAKLLNGLLGVEFDVFYRLRTGLLQDRMATIPSTFGADLPQENIGKRDNRGFELVVNHNNKINDFVYGVSANLTWTREKYVHFEEREFDLDDPDDARLNKKTGEWVNRTFGYRTDGFYDSQEEIDNDNLEYPELGEPALGDIKYVDINNDDIINYRDQEVIGRGSTPELFFGLNVDMAYKGFDFSMLWQGAANYDILIPRNYEAAPNLSIGQIPFTYQAENAWNAENPSAAKLPAPSLGGPNTHNKPASDLYLRKGEYLRLKTVNLGYTLPKSITQKVNINRVRLYVAAYNLFTLMPNDVFRFDPEAKGGDSGSTYPVQKVITFGVNVEL